MQFDKMDGIDLIGDKFHHICLSRMNEHCIYLRLHLDMLKLQTRNILKDKQSYHFCAENNTQQIDQHGLESSSWRAEWRNTFEAGILQLESGFVLSPLLLPCSFISHANGLLP